MNRLLGGSVAALLVFAGASVCGCGAEQAATTGSSTTISETTTTAPPQATWNPITPEGAAPSARCYQAMVYDSTRGLVIMYGGSDGATSLEETWSYDPSSNRWAELEPEGEGQPTASRQMPGAYDSTRLRIITFDGTSWGYDAVGNVWYALGPKGDRLSPARFGPGMVKDDQSGNIILFGGTDRSTSYDETWMYDPGENTWTELEPEGEVPPGRSDAGMVYDPESGSILLFGGINSDFECLDDTWSYDPDENTWTELSPPESPSARSDLAMAYDRHSKKIILFGGIDSEFVCYNDTWALDPATGEWEELTPPGNLPLARGRAALVYVPRIDGLVIFGGATYQADDTGGFGAVAYLDDMWVYGLSSGEETGSEVDQGTGAVTSTTAADQAAETTTTSD